MVSASLGGHSKLAHEAYRIPLALGKSSVRPLGPISPNAMLFQIKASAKALRCPFVSSDGVPWRGDRAEIGEPALRRLEVKEDDD